MKINVSGPTEAPEMAPTWHLGRFSPLRRHLGATCPQHGGQDGNLQATWPNLGRTGAVLEGSGAVFFFLSSIAHHEYYSLGVGFMRATLRNADIRHLGIRLNVMTLQSRRPQEEEQGNEQKEVGMI